jgi:hypothetical protein
MQENKYTMKIKYSLKKLYPGIYLCKIEDMYDLAMTFCRVQEFYESPFKQIRGHRFTLVELMATYAKGNNGSFSYPLDWGGFNLKGSTIKELFNLGIDDFNIYDSIIKKIHDKIINEVGSSQYYLMGADNNKLTIEHELCHAFYFIEKNYKKTVDDILIQLSTSTYKKIKNALLDMGYCRDVIQDEIQAYLTIDYHTFKKRIKFTSKEIKDLTQIIINLKKNYHVYRKNIKL